MLVVNKNRRSTAGSGPTVGGQWTCIVSLDGTTTGTYFEGVVTPFDDRPVCIPASCSRRTPHISINRYASTSVVSYRTYLPLHERTSCVPFARNLNLLRAGWLDRGLVAVKTDVVLFRVKKD
jgi:hypothetical protein